MNMQGPKQQEKERKHRKRPSWEAPQQPQVVIHRDHPRPRAARWAPEHLLDDNEFYLENVEQLARALDVEDRKRIAGIHAFIYSLWQKNQGLPAILKCPSREQFWSKHRETMRQRLIGND